MLKYPMTVNVFANQKSYQKVTDLNFDHFQVYDSLLHFHFQFLKVALSLSYCLCIIFEFLPQDVWQFIGL